MSSKTPRFHVALGKSGWLPMTLLATLGIFIGYYFSGPNSASQTDNHRRENSSPLDNAPLPRTAEQNSQSPRSEEATTKTVQHAVASAMHRFPLTSADVKDTQGAPDLAVQADGSLQMTWASLTAEGEQTCFVASSRNGVAGFSEPRTLARSAIAFRSQGNGKKGYPIRMAPHIAAYGNVTSVTWSEAIADATTVRMVLVQSNDHFVTASEPLCVHEHPQARPTFTGMSVGSQGRLACCWLDGRYGKQIPFASQKPDGQDKFLPELRVPGGENDDGVCPCCPMCVTLGPDGTLFVGFRNLAAGYRDMVIARLPPGASEFEGPFPIVPPTWKFDGCPHDGPSLIVADGQLHVAWMDAHTGPQRVYYAVAKLEELQFQVQALHTDGLGTQGNPKLYADAGGIHAVWEESLSPEPAARPAEGHQHGPSEIGAGRGICHAVRPRGANLFGAVQFVRPVAGTYQSRPAIAGDKEDRIYIAWCELNQEGKSLVVTALPGDSPSAISHQAAP